MHRNHLKGLALLLLAASVLAQDLAEEGSTIAEPAAAGTPSQSLEKPVSGAAAPASLDGRLQVLRGALATTQDADGRYRLHADIAATLFNAARVAESLKARDDMVEDTLVPAGRRSLAASSLAVTYAVSRDFPKARRAITRARKLAEDAHAEELETLPNEPANAYLLAEAEIARRTSGSHDLALAKMRESSDLAFSHLHDQALSKTRRQAAANELLRGAGLLVLQLIYNNRRAEALSYVDVLRNAFSAGSEFTLDTVQAPELQRIHAIALSSHDDYDAASTAIDSAIEGFRSAGLVEHGASLANSRRTRLMIALAQGRINEHASDAVAINQAFPVNTALAGVYSKLEAEAFLLATQSNWAEASNRMGAQLAINMRLDGTESPWYKNYAAMQMLYRLQDAARPVTTPEIEKFVSSLATGDADWLDGRYRGAYVEDGALAAILDHLVPKAGQSATPASLALAFRVAELLRSNASQGALLDGAARLAASNPALRALVEQEQLLRFEHYTSRRALSIAIFQIERNARQRAEDELVTRRKLADADSKSSFARTNAQLIDLRKQIAAQFPVYRELISPRIPGAAAIGAALRPGDAYVDFYAGVSSGYAFVVRAGGALTVQRIAATRAEARRAIAALRAPFDASRVPDTPDDPAGFNLAASHGLYKAWVEPLQESLQGVRTLYISAGGVLSNLPWNVLVTRPAAQLNDAAWWISQLTPVQMPSGSALLMALGQKPSQARRAFIAFADPSFSGRADPVAAAPATRQIRHSAIEANASVRSASLDYRKIAPLPETMEEVNAIGTALGADAADLLHGQQASRSRVMRQNLADSRVVAFATHGLLPGQVPGMMKAGLAMAYEGTGLADSVLTIDDIVGLRLDADWVVLSACNTGYASGEAGDSMSALLRGFFASGARSILATQWAVESESARQLTVQTFTSLAQDAKLSKADALAHSQQEMMRGKFGELYRHPYFWAAYFLAGSAGR